MRFGIRFRLITVSTIMMFLSTAMIISVGSSTNSEINRAAVLIFALLVPFVICAVILIQLISRSFLGPLKELDLATKKIIEGNLDFELSYKKKNEMGDFCAAFDLMREKLKDSLEKQTALENSRRELIANISHDLRTPITSIKGYVEGLQDGIFHDEKRFNRYIAVIKNKTESLDRLIDDLFQFSQLEIGCLEIHRSIQNADAMLNKILNPMETEFIDSNIQLIVNKPFPSVSINADAESIAQVFDNLINNAKRYVGENGIITISSSAQDDFLKIAVKDNGIGIASADLPHVFERFYRGEKSRSRKYGGIGLGLSICKQIIEKHGGVIWVESISGTGTTFYFKLPIS